MLSKYCLVYPRAQWCRPHAKPKNIEPYHVFMVLFWLFGVGKLVYALFTVHCSLSVVPYDSVYTANGTWIMNPIERTRSTVQRQFHGWQYDMTHTRHIIHSLYKSNYQRIKKISISTSYVAVCKIISVQIPNGGIHTWDSFVCSLIKI